MTRQTFVNAGWKRMPQAGWALFRFPARQMATLRSMSASVPKNLRTSSSRPPRMRKKALLTILLGTLLRRIENHPVS